MYVTWGQMQTCVAGYAPRNICQNLWKVSGIATAQIKNSQRLALLFHVLFYAPKKQCMFQVIRSSHLHQKPMTINGSNPIVIEVIVLLTSVNFLAPLYTGRPLAFNL